jgi:hypothetical protein
LRAIKEHIESVLDPAFATIDNKSTVTECYAELKGLILNGLAEYATITTTRTRQLSANLHVLLVENCGTSQVQLTPQLNNVIKPLLTQVKKETNRFLQKVAAKGIVSLLGMLYAQGKVKPA